MKHLFGAGHVAERIIKNAIFGTEYRLYDNNSNMQNTSMLGIRVEASENVKGREGDIIICTTSVGEIQDQLESLNISNQIIIAPEIQEFQSQYELDSFSGEFLICSGLPSNNLRGASGGLYSIKIRADTTVITEIIPGSCHGITRTSEGYALSHQERGILLLGPNFEVQATFDVPNKSRVHGVCFAENKIWTVCSNRDSIIGFNEDGKIFKEIFISKKYLSAGTAQHHANDIEIIEGHAFISMFSLAGEWKNGVFDGGVMRINLADETKTNLISGLSLPHSVKKVDRSVFVLNSFKGQLFSFNKEREYSFNGFLRGFDFDDDNYYFGESRNRNSTGLIPLKFPISVDTHIQIVDRKYGYGKSIPFPAKVSEIHSILKIG